jgi:hypothetical protein
MKTMCRNLLHCVAYASVARYVLCGNAASCYVSATIAALKPGGKFARYRVDSLTLVIVCPATSSLDVTEIRYRAAFSV